MVMDYSMGTLDNPDEESNWGQHDNGPQIRSLVDPQNGDFPLDVLFTTKEEYNN